MNVCLTHTQPTAGCRTRQRHTLTLTLSVEWDLMFDVISVASLNPAQTRPGLAQRCLTHMLVQYTQPKGWLPDIHSWHHRLVIKSICLLPSYLSLSLSPSFIGNLSLIIHQWLCLHICCPLLSLSFTIFLCPQLCFFLFFFASDLSLGSTVKLECDFDCQVKKKL